MLSQKTRYALHACIYLARKGAPASVVEISEAAGIPRKFLEQIMATLKTRGIATSRRGAGGGYALAKQPDAITFAEVMRATGGPLALAPCASQHAFRPCPDCKSVETCEIRPIMTAVRDTTVILLEGFTLKSAIDGATPF